MKTGPSETEASCRIPLLLVFASAAVWLVIGSVFALIASLKFHSPNILADCAWLTYGRVRPVANDCLLYGFCLQAGLGAGLWLLTKLGGAIPSQQWLMFVGAKLWNLGVTVGVVGILGGNTTGFENLEMPAYAALILFLGYFLIAVWGLLNFHQRRERQLYVSQWFLLAALFWFPWIYSAANLLLVTFPVRGAAQAVVAWWFSQNLLVVWLGLVGIGAILYFVPKLTNRDLHSRYLALAAFWSLLLFGSSGGIPNGAPVPAWMPALSTVATVLTLFSILTVALNICGTLERSWSKLFAGPCLRFIGFGVIALIVGSLMNALGSFSAISRFTGLTWFTPAQSFLNGYGFFAMTMFGAIYYILPGLTGIEFPAPKLVRAHFWLASIGVVLIVVPLAIGGVAQGHELQNPSVAFMDIVKATLPFLRTSTMGELLLLIGHVIFIGNIAGMVCRLLRARASAAYTEATADLFQATEVRR